MVGKEIGYTQVFCDEVVLLMEEDINEAIKDLEVAIGKGEEAFRKVKITEYEVDVLISLIASDDTHLPLEPLWVRNQQQKSFKRGKR